MKQEVGFNSRTTKMEILIFVGGEEFMCDGNMSHRRNGLGLHWYLLERLGDIGMALRAVLEAGMEFGRDLLIVPRRG